MPTAPYCNVTVAQPPGKPVSPKGLAPIPPMQRIDLRDINNMISIINNNFTRLGGNSVEFRQARTSIVTRIFDPADKDTWVDVRQITGVTWFNPLTGQTITWQR